MISRAILAIFLWCAATLAHAQSYSWPADLISGFNCTLVAAGEYNCPSMSFSKDVYIVITAPLVVHVNGNFSASKNFIIPKGSPLLLDVKGTVTFSKDMNAYMDIQSTGSMTFAKNTIMHGDLSSGDSITINKDSLVDGDVFTKNTLKVGKNSSISGDCSYATTNYYCHKVPPPPAGNVDHFLVEHDGTGLTCAPAEVTVWACAGASSGGTCPTTSVGASGTLVVTAGGATIASYPFNIAAGQTNATVFVPYAGTKTVNFGTTAGGTTCWDGTSGSCQFTYNDSGFDFNVPDHVSATCPLVDMYAVSKAQGSDTCAPAFTGAKPVTFTCAYVDPATSAPMGSRPVILQSGSSIVSLTCGGGAQTISMTFDSDGKGQFSVNYADVGRLQLAAAYAPANMNGSSSFTVYPRKFAVTSPTPGALIAAGDSFSVTVTALNDAGKVTPNYGLESNRQSAVLSFSRCLPSDGEDGVFTPGTLGAFKDGVATASGNKWDEVGTGDVIATNPNYLASGQPVTGSSSTALSGCSGAFGRFRPHHFETIPIPAWTYSGQPFGVTVIARNAANGTTHNYYVKGAEAFARDMTLSAWSDAAPATANPGPGALTANAVPATAFTLATDGEVIANPVYTFAAPLTRPTQIRVRAIDADKTTSENFTEKTLEVRSGRVKISNAFGPRGRDLDVPVRLEYYTGNSWLLNQLDSATVLPAGAFALSPPALMTGVAVSSDVSFKLGIGNIHLTKPGNAATDKNGSGTVSIAANLGSTASDASCLLAPRPASTGAGLAWLRSLYGSCNTNWTQDPTARATFDAPNPENKSTVFGREVFN